MNPQGSKATGRGVMTLHQASQYLPRGIQRPGWNGYIQSGTHGRIWFVHPDGRKEKWYAYKQDTDADDWMVRE